jgi:polyribonucleotide nucleotidyltransferase
MTPLRVEREIAGRKLSIETGKVARQADAATWVQYGDTIVLATVVWAEPREGLDFFPLTVDYREKPSAAGKIPGGFFKREGRPSTKEILTMRMIDRPCRPLFPKDFVNEVQIQVFVMSADQENDPDIVAMIATSAALRISSLPWDGPIGAVRVGRVEGKFILNPTHAQMEYSDLDLILAGHAESINMIELGADQISEADLAGAIQLGHGVIGQVCELIEDLASKCAKEKVWTPPVRDEDLYRKVYEKAYEPLLAAKQIPLKQKRGDAVAAVYEQVLRELCGIQPGGAVPAAPAAAGQTLPDPKVVGQFLSEVEEKAVRDLLLVHGKRVDDRGPTDIRPIWGEVGVLPRTHGSALFSRGETQALAVATLGTVGDEQIIDGLVEEYSKKFMLHYNFPPFATGEVKRIGAPSRREIGHGAIGERSLERILPSPDKFPYTIRIVSDILESNGSSSMATVCAGTLSLMDAGVPIKEPVAGISIGMMHNEQKEVLLTDILGEEDHFGDMDFKVAGTRAGITGIQVDLKIRGLRYETIVQTLERARQARLAILDRMREVLDKPRPTISDYAPRILTVRIDPDKIGKVIGPGGKGIKRIEQETGATIEIEEDGTVLISCVDRKGAEQARDEVLKVTEEVQIGRLYTGKVVGIRDFGAFIEVLPGTDGLCHISELADGYVKTVNDVVQLGDTVRVKVIAIDEQGRVKLSRKQALKEESEQTAGSA